MNIIYYKLMESIKIETNNEVLNNFKHDIMSILDSLKTASNTDKIEDLFLTKFLQKYDKNINGKSEYDQDEEILNPDRHKFTAFPIEHESQWQIYKTQRACFWIPEEIDFSGDYTDFLTLNENEQHFVEMILAFFAASDGIVNFNLSERFTREVQITEAQMAYHFQMMMEDIHSITYSLMLENIVKDKVKKEYLFNAIKTVPAVKRMADWAFKWIDSSDRFAYRLIAFAIVEGVFFSGAFAAIFWLKYYKNKGSESKGKPFMNGLITSNKFISRDEGLHTDFACDLYSKLKHRLSQDEVNNIMNEGVQIAKEFMIDSIPVKLIGMNNDMMSEYIEYIADRLLVSLGYKKNYNKRNPFKFMEAIGLSDRTNFHETRPTEYQSAHSMKNQIDTQTEIVISDDF